MTSSQLNTQLCFKPERNKKDHTTFDTIQKPE